MICGGTCAITTKPIFEIYGIDPNIEITRYFVSLYL